MIGWIRTWTKKIVGPDLTAPPLLGPDRNPSVRQFHEAPLLGFYDPNEVKLYAFMMPTQPHAPDGAQSNADCKRQAQVNWDRLKNNGNGCQTKEFFRRVMRTTGLEHV